MKTNNLWQIFEKTCQQYADRTALILQNKMLTYQELLNKTNHLAKCLHDNGVKPGNKFLLAIDDPLIFIPLWYAVWKLNCIAIPLEISANTEEIKKAADVSETHFIILDKKTTINEINQIKGKLLVADDDSIIFFHLHDCNDDTISQQTALFFYTSGTTGLSKCVMFTHEAMRENILSLAAKIGLNPTDVVFTPLSPVLPATLATAVLPALSVGAGLVISKSALPGMILKIAAETKTTVFFAVPYIYDLLNNTLKLRKTNYFDKIRLCLTSSAFLKESIFNEFFDLTGLAIRSIYCSSEAGACTINNETEPELAAISVGIPLDGVNIRIVDDHFNPVGRNKPGQILISGTHLAEGYYHRPELNEAVFHDGWVKTGDAGYLDDNGYLYLTGRISITLNVSGYLVNPIEVEQIIMNHAMVRDALVYPYQHPDIGEVVGVKIVLKDSTAVYSEKQFLDYCAANLNSYKIPKHVEIVNEIPTSRYGKKIRSTSQFVR